MEKEKKEKKSGRGASWSLGDKLKSARRSSKKISNYAFSKLGEGQESIRRRLKRGPKDANTGMLREAHSDTEDDKMSSQSTPLLFSMSASTQNLSSPSLKQGGSRTSRPTPPPKPPRTFKTKDLQDVASECPDSDADEEDICGDKQRDFSIDVLSAIKQVGEACVEDGEPEEGVANGHIPSIAQPSSSSPASSGSSGSKVILRSESSPQLSRSSLSPALNGSETAATTTQNLTETSLRLQTITEDNTTDSAHVDSDHSLPSPAPVPTEETDSQVSVEVVVEGNTVHALSKQGPSTQATPTSLSTSLELSVDASSSTSTNPTPDSSFTTPPTDFSLSDLQQQDPTLLDQDQSTNKRYSIYSTTSADFYSAESSDSSKANSPSPSSDIMLQKALLPMSPRQRELGEEELRALSSMSVETDNFDTPPSSPLSSRSSSPEAGDSTTQTPIHTSYAEKSVTATPTSPGSTPSHTSTASTPKIGHMAANVSTGTLRPSGDSSTLKAGFRLTDIDADGHETYAESLDTCADSHVTGAGSFEVDGHVTDPGTPKASHVASHMTGSNTASNGTVEEDVEAHMEEDVEADGEVHFSIIEEQEETIKSESSDRMLSPHKQLLQKRLSEPGGEAAKPSTREQMLSSSLELGTKNRSRSLTVSCEGATLPLRGKGNKNKGVLSSITSHDDNFGTEYKDEGRRLSNSDGLVSYFSQQDLEDIFKVSAGKYPGDKKIEPLKEGDEEEKENEEEEEEGAVKGEEDVPIEDEKLLKESPGLDVSAASSVFGSTAVTPEQNPTSPEVVIIPPDITPNRVKGHHCCFLYIVIWSPSLSSLPSFPSSFLNLPSPSLPPFPIPPSLLNSSLPPPSLPLPPVSTPVCV